MKAKTITTIIWATAISVSLLGTTSCSEKQNSPDHAGHGEKEMHEEHKGLANEFVHSSNIVVLEERQTVTDGFSQGIAGFYKEYLNLEDAFVNHELEKVDIYADTMMVQLPAIDTTGLNDKSVEAWLNHSAAYTQVLKEMRHVEGLEEKRGYFAHLSEVMYCTFKSFELKNVVANAAFCPMAFDDKGAYWLTSGKEIRNPYFGSKMLKCGKIKEDHVGQ
jgi:hypothetical protein